MESTIAQPVTLSCRLPLKNRLVKAAMAERMADHNAFPTALHNNVYREWGEGGWGMILTGNVQVDKKYLGDARDVARDPANEAIFLEKWTALAQGCMKDGSSLIMQINHPGRQSPVGAGTRGFCQRNIAPSAILLNLGNQPDGQVRQLVCLGTPREMTQGDIDTVVQQFVDTSLLAHRAGLQGVEIHAAHGYLLAQFLSSETNLRTDRYGDSAEGRARIVTDIIQAIRKELPETFCVVVKLNSVDHQSREALEACLKQLKLIIAAGVDFVEISGGTYEDPQPQAERSASTKAREAFFLEFARAIRHDLPDVPLLATGAVLQPGLPNKVILNEKVVDEEAHFPTQPVAPSWFLKHSGVKSAGSSAESKLYSRNMQERGRQYAATAAS
ncbi:FMN binding oxidoreductase [Aspergillus aurantiobrunneus]